MLRFILLVLRDSTFSRTYLTVQNWCVDAIFVYWRGFADQGLESLILKSTAEQYRCQNTQSFFLEL